MLSLLYLLLFTSHSLFLTATSVAATTATAPAMSTMMVEEWLTSIKMEQYWPDFKETGYDLMEIVKDLDDGMLDLLPKKLPPGHHYQLLKKANEIVLWNCSQCIL